MTTVTKFTTTAAAGAEVHPRRAAHGRQRRHLPGGLHAVLAADKNWPKPTRNRLRK